MSYQETPEPLCKPVSGSIELCVEPKEKSLGEFTVRRVLPSIDRRRVGPFVFFDHMGPAEFPPGKGINVRPHPHIGLSTVTYLFDGEIMHRDSLGYAQAIHEGAVNLMTAGKGIVHSERAGDDLHEVSTLHGIQTWMALPTDKAEMDPAFEHFPADVLPDFDIDGAHIRIIMGTAYGHTSPVTTHSPTLYLACEMPAGIALTLPDHYDEIAVYAVSGKVRIDDETYSGGVLAVASPGAKVTVSAEEQCLFMVIGGDSIGERKVWWNFVASSAERMEQAKRDWKEGRFGTVPGDDEFIPLPE
ncbi:MAG TPA: pirin family protein [Woeseiaceae bacterium]|nr:pirin family protein [Woeseiaceae bacterium]